MKRKLTHLRLADRNGTRLGRLLGSIHIFKRPSLPSIQHSDQFTESTAGGVVARQSSLLETLPYELITLIVEYACTDDFGKTARNIGLVSKHLRAIAEPVELRGITVCGLKQLKRLHLKMQRIWSTGRTDVAIRHLLISELDEHHATVLRSSRWSPMKSFWHTWAGERTVKSYIKKSGEFWRLSTVLIKNASPTLKTLSLLVPPWTQLLLTSARVDLQRPPRVRVFEYTEFTKLAFDASTGSGCLRVPKSDSSDPSTCSLQSLTIWVPHSVWLNNSIHQGICIERRDLIDLFVTLTHNEPLGTAEILARVSKPLDEECKHLSGDEDRLKRMMGYECQRASMNWPIGRQQLGT